LLKSTDLSAADLISAFQANTTVGTCGSGNELGLRSIIEALKHAQGSDCNAGFLRDDANLVIILISDDDDEDPTGMPAAQFVDLLSQFKDISKVRFALIGGAVDGVPRNCRIMNNGTCGQSICNNKPPDGDHAACGTAMPNACPGPSAMYPEGEYCQLLPQSAMGTCENKELEYYNQYQCDLCSFFAEDNYGDTLARIAHELINPAVFLLNPPAEYPPGIVVKIVGGRFGADGITLTYGTDFTVLPDGTQLTIINPDKVPQGTETIEIYFIVAN
jgi:hypothetical protein